MISLSPASTASSNAATQLRLAPSRRSKRFAARLRQDHRGEAEGATLARSGEDRSGHRREKRISRTTPSPPGQRPLPPLTRRRANDSRRTESVLKDFVIGEARVGHVALHAEAAGNPLIPGWRPAPATTADLS